MDKDTVITRANLLPAYCEATGFFPDECAGASDFELRDELVSMGFLVEGFEEITATAWVAPVVSAEARDAAPGFWA